MNVTICFIGAGNMAKSLIGGLIASGYNKEKIIATDPSNEQRAALTQSLGIKCYDNNQHAIEKSDVVVLAVKPQVLQTVCNDIQNSIQAKSSLVISVAAGIRSQDINHSLAGNVSIVRAMPNTPAAVGRGITVAVPNSRVSPAQQTTSDELLSAVGEVAWITDEAQIDAVTALSGGGPAYVFLLMEVMAAAGVARADRRAATASL